MKNTVENIEFSSEKANIFLIETEGIKLKQFDVYKIPVNVEHEIVGLANENLFTVAQEL